MIVAVLLIIAGFVTCLIAQNMAEAEGQMLFAENRDYGLVNTLDLAETAISKLEINVQDADVHIYGGSESSYIELVNFRENYYSCNTSNRVVTFDEVPDVTSMLKFWENGVSFKGIRYLLAFGEEEPVGDKVINIYLGGENIDLKIVSVTGTFNMIDPDPAKREDGIRRFEELAKHMHELECNFVTLCTGSRSAESMWRMHPDSLSDDAWADLLETTAKLLEIAEKYDLILGLETEPNNAMNTPERCRALMDHFGTKRLQVIMDIANLFRPGMAKKENVRGVMRHAFDLLGKDVYLAHGKDIMESDGIACTYAGNGIVDFAYFKELLDEIGYEGCMLLHGLHDEEEFPKATQYVRGVIG